MGADFEEFLPRRVGDVAELRSPPTDCCSMERTLKETTTVCPDCLERVPGTVVARDAGIFLKRACPVHGQKEALLASDSALYWNQGDVKACGTSCCGAADNHSCSLIFEITERCNLTCPTCFTASSPHLSWSFRDPTNRSPRRCGKRWIEAALESIFANHLRISITEMLQRR